MDYRKLASQYRDLGMVVIPVDENKQPKNVSWHFFQDRQMEDWEIEKLAMREILARMTQNPSYMMFF